MTREELKESVKRLGPLRFEGGPFYGFLGHPDYRNYRYRLYRTEEGVPYSVGKNRRGWTLDLVIEEVRSCA